MTVYVDDTFGRTTSNGWGSATTGGAYSISGTAANFSVASGCRLDHLADCRRAALGAAQHTVGRRRRRELQRGGRQERRRQHQFVYAVVRRNGTNEYRVKLRFDTNGNVYVGASTVINNTETNIGDRSSCPA